MPYQNHFDLADNYIAHTDTVVNSISDPFIKQRYVGFITISAVTVYELAIKEILIEFAKKKHKVFGTFTEEIYNRINGRVSLKDLRNLHIKRFGEKYLKRFNVKMEKKEKDFLIQHGRSIKSSYGNVISWRHEFVHEGNITTNASYNEAVQAYKDGKEVIVILSEIMVR